MSTRILVAAGSGRQPEGWREVVARHAEQLGVESTWREAPDAEALAAILAAAGDEHDAVVLVPGELAAAGSVSAAVRELPIPVACAEPAPLTDRTVVHGACDRVVHGRGRRSITGALRWAVAAARDPGTTVTYGPSPAQVGDLRIPPGADAAPVVVLFHGGFWLDVWERDLMDGLAVALTGHGWATWNVEYRRTGPSGGGWPATWENACAAVDAVADLADDHAIDPDRVVVLGHSAGATLAVYPLARPGLGDHAPGTPPRIRPRALVSLAGLLDLEAAAAAAIGDGAVTACLGDPATHPDRYALASPHRLVPLGAPTLLLHGHADRLVPADQSRAFATTARDAGDDVTLDLVDTDHFAIIHPDEPAIATVASWLSALARG